MELVICAVRDYALDAFGRPFFSPSRGVAIRSFIDEVNERRADNQLNKHPGDFDLYILGKFNDQSGSFELTPPEIVIRGTDAIQKGATNGTQS